MYFHMLLRLTVTALCLVAAIASGEEDRRSDVVVIGAGVAGMATALEAARQGATVTVLDMSSVFGGHAVMSEGGLSLVDTATQRKLGVSDSVAQARKDFIRWGETPNTKWVDRYLNDSSAEVHDWLVEMGLRFTTLRRTAGNTVARFHENSERGLGVAKVLFLRCLESPNIDFKWNTQAVGILRERGAATGVHVIDIRTGAKTTIRASAVVLATGGFQSNIEFLRKNWPSALTFPERMLVGSGVNSQGSGHEMASSAGAALVNLDRQWNYPWGVPDPRYPDGVRGISVRMPMAIWVNKKAQRFVDEHASPKTSIPALLAQPGATYWAIFDAPGKDLFVVAGTDWTDNRRVHALLLNSTKVVKQAVTLAQLAREIGLPETELPKTVDRYNDLVARGVDEDFARFGKGGELDQSAHRRPPAKIVTPPFYAIQMYPLSRKSMGGIAIDESCRVLDKKHRVIQGLYAVGEATGHGGLNGVAALEGTFLAPGILQGRIVGRQFKRNNPTPPANILTTSRQFGTPGGKSVACDTCHNVKQLIASKRPGFWHFDRVHTRVLDKNYECAKCHSDMIPFRPAMHKIDRVHQADQCGACHLAAE